MLGHRQAQLCGSKQYRRDKMENKDIVIDVLQQKIGELEVDKAFAIAKIVKLEQQLKELEEAAKNKS